MAGGGWNKILRNPKTGRPILPADPAHPKRKASMAAAAEAKNETENRNENSEATPSQDGEGDPQESAVSDTQIGLSPDPPPLAESTPETDTYLCGRCRSPIDHGTGYCPICNARLNW